MEKIKKLTAIQIIDQTVKYYSEDVTRRAKNKNGGCSYITPDSKMCAYGRCMTEETLSKIEGSGLYAGKLGNPDDMVKEQYKGYDIIFWRNLQNIHDEDRNWNEKGLTTIGKEKVKEMKKVWKGK